jgi:hypothetical protein
MPQSQRRGHKAKHAVSKQSVPQAERKDWRKTVDHGLEILICVGHIVGAFMLVAEHLM